MLLNFTLENWMSFRDPVEFSMIAGRERQHGERVPVIAKNKSSVSVLPIAVLYGGNASGKSNFFKALTFVQNFVTKNTTPDQSIAVDPFLLDTRNASQPAKFSIELLADETIYVFSFAVDQTTVLEEELARIDRPHRRTLLYRRRGQDFVFDDAIIKAAPDKEEAFFLKVVQQSTRPNQLFLTRAADMNMKYFRSVYNWFKDLLVPIAPNTKAVNLIEYLTGTTLPIQRWIHRTLSRLDTGITRIDCEEYPLEAGLSLEEQLAARLLGKTDIHPVRNDGVQLYAKDGRLHYLKQLITLHQNAQGEEIPFALSQESDGTRRLIHLLPAFLELLRDGSNHIYVIDEIDRSLHPLLVYHLIETYLGSRSPQSRTQLLLTTHDLNLMDQMLLRRDEIWIAERDRLGISKLIPFSAYKDIRYDKDIRKSYLQGRLGGIPRMATLDDEFALSIEPSQKAN